MIRVDNVSRKFGKNMALSNVSLVCEPGIVTGIVGANGAGKTTLFRCIAGLISHQGNIEFHPDEFRLRIGYMPTNPDMLSLITGEEYLRLMCNARGITDIDTSANNIFELPLSDYAETYSTGMKKKLALTGILMQKNDVFLLDEPFSGVDVQSNMVIKEIIIRLKELNKTILMSSHIFSALHDVCDMLYYISEGQIKDSAYRKDFGRIEQDMLKNDMRSKLRNLKLD